MTTDSTGATSDSKDDGKQGLAPPADESQGEKSPGDWIKKSQFVAALNSATAKTDALEREVRELRAAQVKATEPKVPTRAELLKFVDAGELTREQADAIWEKQIKEAVKREVVAEVGVAAGAQERASRVEAELSGYKAIIADAWVEGSPERDKVTKEYRHLLSLGHAPTKETEAAALRAAFGDLETLRTSKSARSGPSETHEETGGGKLPDSGGGKDGLKGLSSREKEYYEAGIKAGRYKDWKAVAAELEYANPNTRRKMGAKV